jgi:ABC-2 type transport system permease protein
MNRTALVIRRELRERLRSRAFQVATLISVLVVGGAIILPALNRNPFNEAVKIGVADRSTASVDAQLAAAKGVLKAPTKVSAVATEAAGLDALKHSKLDVLIVGTKDIFVREGDQTTDRMQVASTLSFLPALTGRPIALHPIGAPRPQASGRFTAFLGVILTYTFVAVYGGMVLNGVAEEKSSRVAEVLLSAVRPGELLVGKVTGIGLVALIQGLITAAAAFAAGAAVGTNILRGTGGFSVLAMLGWFLLGYTFYSFVNAAAGSLVNRQEEASSMAFPIQLPLLVGYLTTIGALSNGDDSKLLRLLSFLPPTAPVTMPIRIAIGAAKPWQIALSLGLLVGGIALVARLASRVYARSILRTGKRLKFRQALRAAPI